MILRPFSLKKVQKFVSQSSPKASKGLKYLRLKTNRQKSSKGGRSLCSIQTYRDSNTRRILSHRKLISLSSLDQKQNLTDRKCTVQSQNGKSHRNLVKEKQSLLKKQQLTFVNKKNIHLNKFCNFRNDRLHTIQNQEVQTVQRVLQIKQNILKEFIDRFQEELREISQQKSSRKTLITNRIKTQGEVQKNQTAKKQRKPMQTLQTNNNSTINFNLGNLEKRKSNYDLEQQKNKFEDYLKQIKNIKKKDQKIFILKNQKKSCKNISLSKIGQTQNITARIGQKQNNKKLNLKDLFKHSKKYEPYFKQSQTVSVLPKKIQQIKQKGQNQQISCLLSPIKFKQEYKQKQDNKQRQQGLHKQQEGIYKQKQSGYADCSSIQKMNQSSFISEMGRKSILKHLQNESIKIIKNEQRKSKKCLAKMKNIFPSDFF